MSDHEKLVIPAGVRFGSHVTTLDIEHAGDIEIHGALDCPVNITSTGGSVTLTGGAHVGEVRAAARVVVNGDVKARLFQADSIDVTGGRLQCEAIQARSLVTLGAAKVELDIVMAPEVTVDPTAQGRVAVIEAENDQAPNALKGGFSLKDFCQFTSQDPDQFLSERGLSRLAPSSQEAPLTPAVAQEFAPPSPTEDEVPISVSPEDEADDDESVSSASEDAPSPIEAAASPIDIPAFPATGDPIQQTLLENAERIVSCYEERELPPAVLELRELLQQEDYQKVREEITTLWNNLLKFHQKRGMRIQHQVTTTFNTINSIVRKMESA